MRQTDQKRWIIPPIIPADIDRELCVYPPFFRQILFNRGIQSQKEADEFLLAREPVYDPGLLKGMQTACEIIFLMIAERKRIVILGDYDVDGVTATALLVQCLQRLNADVDMFIPNRFIEGYGFSMDALEKVLSLKPDLIITVDCGIRSIREVEQASEFGIETIITDHHQTLDNLPAASAIICPKQAGDLYPNKNLSGVGLAFKLAQSVLSKASHSSVSYDAWLDLVALGTVADLAPLTGENRVLVRSGIDQMRKAPRIGLKALAEVSGIKLSNVDSSQIGFVLAPRLNAAGRLNSARKAYDLLMTDDDEAAEQLARELHQTNQERQDLLRLTQSKVEDFVNNQKDLTNLILYADKDFNEGVVGLTASRLVESCYRPAIIGVEKDGLIRASCRSIPGFNITQALDECQALIIQHGGHAMAAGLTISKENLSAFESHLNALICERLSPQDFQPTVNAEMEIPLDRLPPSYFEFVDKIEPTGVENPKVLFISRGLTIREIRTVGKEQDHLRLVLAVPDGNNEGKIIFHHAIAFRMGYCLKYFSVGNEIDIVFSFEINTYQNQQTLQLNIREIKPSPQHEGGNPAMQSFKLGNETSREV